MSILDPIVVNQTPAEQSAAAIRTRLPQLPIMIEEQLDILKKLLWAKVLHGDTSWAADLPEPQAILDAMEEDSPGSSLQLFAASSLINAFMAVVAAQRDNPQALNQFTQVIRTYAAQSNVTIPNVMPEGWTYSTDTGKVVLTAPTQE